MAYSEVLAEQFRDGLKGVDGVSEKKMMGGLCLLVHGNMVGGVDHTKDGRDRFMFRVGKANEAEALARPGAEVMEMGGRRMSGLIFVDADACDLAALKRWIALAMDFVGSLPKK